MPPDSSLTDFANQSTAGMQALLDRQKTEQQGLFNQYTTTLNNQEKLPALYDRLSTSLGIPDASKAVQGYKDEAYRVKGLLDRLSEDVTSRNLGTYTTSAMRDRIQASEQAPLETQLSRIGTGMQPFVDQLTGAQQQLSTLLPLYAQQQDRELDPLKLQINAVSDRFAREITGYTSGRQEQLNALLDQVTRGRQLSDRDWQLTQDLAKEERGYHKQLSVAKASNTASYFGGGGAKANGEFAFTNASGQPISAATYASLTGTPIGQVLSRMAASGNTYAANAYRWIQSVQGSDAFKKNGTALAIKNFPALFWGAA